MIVATSVSAVQHSSKCNCHCYPREHGETPGISWSVSGMRGTPGVASSTANSVSPEPPKWGILWMEEKPDARLPGRTWGARETIGLLGKLSSNSILGPSVPFTYGLKEFSLSINMLHFIEVWNKIVKTSQSCLANQPAADKQSLMKYQQALSAYTVCSSMGFPFCTPGGGAQRIFLVHDGVCFGVSEL